MEISNYNRKRSSLFEWISMLKNSLMGMLGSSSAYKKFYQQFGINCNKGYGIKGDAPLLPNYAKARAINGLTKAILKHPVLQPQTTPPYKITVTYGDRDIYGTSPKWVWERYPTAKFVTIPGSSHMHWLQNPKVFLATLAKHFQLSS